MKLMAEREIKIYWHYYKMKSRGGGGGGLAPTGNSMGEVHSAPIYQGSGLSNAYYDIYHNIYIEKDDKLMLVKKWGFNKKMIEYISDYEELANNVRSEKLKFKDLDFIVRSYNKFKKEH